MAGLSPPTGFTGRFLTDLTATAAYSEGAGAFRIVPRAVAFPTDLKDLALLARDAAERGTALTPRGAGSGVTGGNLGHGIVVDLGAFIRPASVNLARTANVGAAVVWQALNETARHFGFRPAPDPSSGAFCTIGGMVATNAAGARSLKAGSIRSWVRGVELVTVDGEAGWLPRAAHRRPPRDPRLPPIPRKLVDRLAAEDRFADAAPAIEAHAEQIRDRFPATRKNSSGYALDRYLESGDLVDLVIGSEGTLGFVTRVELSLELIPDHAGTALVGLGRLDQLDDVIRRILPLNPVALELLDRTLLCVAGPEAAPAADLEAILLVEFEAEQAGSVRGALENIEREFRNNVPLLETALDPAHRDRLWAVRQAASPALAALPAERRSLQVIEDGCVPVARLGEYLAGVRQAARQYGIDVVAFGHAGDGHLHVNALVDTTDPAFERRMKDLLGAVTNLVLSLGGTPSGEHGDGRLRTPLLEQVYGPDVVALFRKVKEAFDPADVMNPGVIVPRGEAQPLEALKVGPRAANIPGEVARALSRVERTAGWRTSPLRAVEAVR